MPAVLPDFRLRRSATLAGVAEGVVATALPLLAANLTQDPLAIAGVIAAQHAPWIVVALLRLVDEVRGETLRAAGQAGGSLAFKAGELVARAGEQDPESRGQRSARDERPAARAA